MKNRIRIILSFSLFTFISSISSFSNEEIDKKISEELLAAFMNTPESSEKIDNIKIRLIQSKVNPQNATKCIQSFPHMLSSTYLQSMSEIPRIRTIRNFVNRYEEIFEAIDPVIYLDVSKTIKSNKQDNKVIYYLVNQALRNKSMDERIACLPRILELFPLDKGVNTLMSSTLYTRYGEEKCFEIMDELKSRYQSDSDFIKELDEAKERIIKNKNRDRSGIKIEFSH